MGKAIISAGYRVAAWPAVALACLVVCESIVADDAGRSVEGAAVESDFAADRGHTADRLTQLDLLSDALIEKAAVGNSPAHQFRIDARMYRELLRQFMLQNRERPPIDQAPPDLLLEMVRMSALLHAAADCKTGFVIVCPPDLMRQLKSQQVKIDQRLRLLHLPGH